ncbi:MAG: Hsp70 family protein [Blastocatellia bacterium]|nr:Hsp70 family protein [Blastocatellia bacterium]
MAFHKVIGIDLGTTYSAVSVWDHSTGEVIVIPSATGSNTVPSVVGLDPEEKVIVGAPAQNNLVMDPANTIIEVKREMGVYEREPNPATDDPGSPLRVRFRNRDYLPQEISAFIVMELKRQAENYIGEPIHDAVITVPAYFKEPQKGATADAAAMARLNLKRLLNEPTAAAVCFGADKVQDGRKHIYAVYDLGGGTFDVSIIEVSEGNVGVVGTGGDPRLGGGDFDDRITSYVVQQIQAKHGVDLSQDPQYPVIWARIKREAEMRKREISAATAATLNLPFLTAQLSVNIPITRAIFESLIEDLLQKSLACLDEAIESAYETNGVERDQIEQVLLVGGSTRIPRIRSLMAEYLGMEEKDIRCDFNPDEVVSRGAAIVARDYNASESYEGKEIIIDMAAGGAAGAAAQPGLVLQDVTSHTLGILANQSDMIPIIPKESRLPAQITQGGFINAGPTRVLEVLIFQGENPVAFENTLIGKIPINLPEAREEGFYKFEVNFGLNNDGLLKVEVKELRTNQIWPAELQCNVRASKAQIDSSANHLAEVLAAGSATADAAAAQAGNLPKPPAPSGLPRPPIPPRPQSHAAPPAPAPPPVAAVPEVPAETPAEFKSIARRSFKLLSTMASSPERDKLLAAYTAFVNAVNSQSPELEDLGDALGDTYMESSRT